MGRLDGKIVVVTGASRGIGADIARQYGVAVKLLVKWNGLDRPDRIFPGERLRVTALPATS